MSAAERSPENTDQYIPGLEQFGQQPITTESTHTVVTPNTLAPRATNYAPVDEHERYSWFEEIGGNRHDVDSIELPVRRTITTPITRQRRSQRLSGLPASGRDATLEHDKNDGGDPDAVPMTRSVAAIKHALLMRKLLAQAGGDNTLFLALVRAHDERTGKK